jgi:hypothetical protein
VASQRGKEGRRRRHQKKKTSIHKQKREKRSDDVKQLSFIFDVISCDDVPSTGYL